MNEPRRMAWQVMIEKNHSTRSSEEYPVRVKRRVTLGFFARYALPSGMFAGCVGVVDDVQLLTGGRWRRLSSGTRELLVAVPVQQASLTWPLAISRAVNRQVARCGT